MLSKLQQLFFKKWGNLFGELRLEQWMQGRGYYIWTTAYQSPVVEKHVEAPKNKLEIGLEQH